MILLGSSMLVAGMLILSTWWISGTILYTFIGAVMSFIGSHIIMAGTGSLSLLKKGVEAWACDCPLCNTFVKPLLYHGLTKPKPPQPMSKSVEKMSEEKREEAREMEELKELVEALRESIIDLKSAIMDMTSPISKVRRREPLEEEEEEHEVPPLSASAEIRSAPTVMTERVEVREKREEKPPEKKEVEKPVVAEEKPREKEKEVVKETVAPTMPAREELLAARVARIDLKKIIKMLRMMYKLAKNIPVDNIENYIKLLQSIGALDERTVEAAKIVKDIVESGLKAGLKAEDQIVAIYSIAKMLGLEDPELEEEILQLVVEKIRGKAGHWEHQQQ